MLFKVDRNGYTALVGNRLFWCYFEHIRYELWYTASHSYSDEQIALKLDKLTNWKALSLGESYSFFLWDKQECKGLFQVDEFATCPLFYREVNGTYFISDLYKELANILPQTLTVHTLFVEEYLRPFSSIGLIHDQTVFREIKRVLPQHAIEITANKPLVMHHYLENWVPAHTNSSGREIIQQFREYFTDSVCASALQKNNVAANLSGGLDSSSIVAALFINSPAKVHAINALIEGDEADESQYVHHLQKEFSVLHVKKVTVGAATGISVTMIASMMGQPEWMAAPSALHVPLFQEVESQQAKVFFSGHGGDSIVGASDEYLVTCWEEVDIVALLSWMKSSHFSSKRHEAAWKRISPLWREKGVWFYIYTQFVCFIKGVLSLKMLVKSVKGLVYTSTPKRITSLDTNFYRLPTPKSLNNMQKRHWESHFSIITITANEVLYTLGRHFGTQVIFPFQDIRLLELALSFDVKMNFANGARRGLLREAMKGILPEKIRNRTSKATFTTYLRKSLQSIMQTIPEGRYLTPLEKRLITENDWRQWQTVKLASLKGKKISMQQIEKCLKIAYFLRWSEAFSRSSS